MQTITEQDILHAQNKLEQEGMGKKTQKLFLLSQAPLIKYHLLSEASLSF